MVQDELLDDIRTVFSSVAGVDPGEVAPEKSSDRRPQCRLYDDARGRRGVGRPVRGADPGRHLGTVLDGRRPRGSPRADRGRCAHMTGSPQEARRRRTVTWVVGLATLGLVFDGYDLVVYGTVVSTFLRNPDEIGAGDPGGGRRTRQLRARRRTRRRPARGRASATSSAVARSCWSATRGSPSSWASPRWRRAPRCSGSGGSSPVSGSALCRHDRRPRRRVRAARGRRTSATPSPTPVSRSAACSPRCWASCCRHRSAGAGMFWIGALPLVTLLPLAYFKMPESVAWLVSRGRIAQAQQVSARTGMPMPDHLPAAPATTTTHATTEAPTTAPADTGRAGYRGLFDRHNWSPTVLLGLTSAMVLLLVYSLNTWLPELMLRAGSTPRARSPSCWCSTAARSSAPFRLPVRRPVRPQARHRGVPAHRRRLHRGADVSRCRCPCCCFRRARRPRNQRHPDPAVRVRRELLPDQRPGGGRRMVRRVRTARRRRRPAVGGILIGAVFAVTQIFLILAGVALLGLALVLLVPHRRHRPTVVTVDPSTSIAPDPSTPAGRP